MKPAPFEYYAPASLEEALTLLSDLGEDAKVLAGGQSLVPAMNLRLARPTAVIDLNRTEGLSGISSAGGEWRIGAMTRHSSVEDSASLRSEMPLLPETVSHIGYRQIRNRGTVGGSICHADPAAEWPMLALLVRAELDVRSARGSRTVAAADCFESVFTTTLEPDEILTAVRFAAPPAPWRWGFSEFARKSGDFALAAVAALLQLSDGVIANASLVAAGVGSTPSRLEAAEAVLVGAALDDVDERRRAAAAAAESVEPMDHPHLSADFKRRLVAVQVERVLEQAHNQPDGGNSGNRSNGATA